MVGLNEFDGETIVSNVDQGEIAAYIDWLRAELSQAINAAASAEVDCIHLRAEIATVTARGDAYRARALALLKQCDYWRAKAQSADVYEVRAVARADAATARAEKLEASLHELLDAMHRYEWDVAGSEVPPVHIAMMKRADAALGAAE